MTADHQFTDAEKLAEAEREIKMRKRVYPRWVSQGRMTHADSVNQIAIMAAIAADYRAKVKPELF